MALSPDSTWTTEAAKVNSRPVYLANLEYDYLRAGVTYQADFKATGYAGDADLDTKPGKVILKQANDDILNNAAWGGSTKDLVYSTSFDGNQFFGTRFKIKKRITINSIVFDCKHTGTITALVVTAGIYPISDEIEKGETDTPILNLSVGEPINGFQKSFTVTTSYQTFTYYPATENGSLTLDPGVYAFMFFTLFPSESLGIRFKTYQPNDIIFNKPASFLGYSDHGIQMGDFYAAGSVFDGPGQSVWGNIYSYVSDTAYPLFDGYIFIKEFNIDVYTNSTYTTPWMRVKNTSGSGATPSTPGQLRLDYAKPLNTNITFALYGDADGSDAGQVTIDSTAFDGDTISSYYDYYKIVCTMTTTDWFSTPEISSLSAYFKLTNDYCKLDDAFTMADGSPARPYLDAIPSYETRVDPINNKVSFNEPTIDLIIQKKGLSKTQSDIETLIETYFMTGKELAIKVGYSGVASTYFLAYQTGTTNNQVWVNDNIYRLECKDPYFQTKDPFLIDQADTFQPYFSYDNPIDIMLTLISLSGIPQRLIDTTSFSTIKSAYFTGWQFYRPYTEPIKDIKKELDEISMLTGVVAVTKEDGKIYCVKLDASDTASVFTFTDQNSKESGKANIDLSKRVNVCSVQRGYWIEPSDSESKDIEYWDTVIDEESILNVGRSEVLKIENKWIPRDITIGTAEDAKSISKIVAERIVSRFRYGLWTLKRQTNLQYAYLQVGDQVSITGSQILYKNFYGENTIGGVIIGKDVRPSAGEYEGEIEFTIWIYANISSALDAEPEFQPTAITFTNTDTDSTDVGWTAASGTPDGYLVLFGTGNYPNTLPEDGNAYSAGETVNDATVAYSGSGTSFTHSSLTSDTEYFYRIFSYNGSGASRNYNKIAPLSGAEWINATEPGGHPSGLTFGTFADPANTNVSWTASGTSPLAQNYLVVRRTSSAVTWTPTDFTAYTIGQAVDANHEVRYVGSAINFDDEELSFSGLTYHYAVYPFRGSDADSYNYRTSATVLAGSKATTAAEPENQPTGFLVSDGATLTAEAEWTAADPVVTGYVILVRAGTSSTAVPVDTTTYIVGDTVGDSTVKYVGSGTSGTLTSLTAGNNIFKLFAYNGGAGAENYLTVSPPSQTVVISN